MTNDEFDTPLDHVPAETVEANETEAEDSTVDQTPDDTNPYADRSYTVGKGKPPTHSQFKPGQSGNPSRGPNRPPNTYMGCLRKEVDKNVQLIINGEVVVMTKMAAAALATVTAAIKGNAYALKQIEKLDGGGKSAEELLRLLEKERKLVRELKEQVREQERRPSGVLAIPAHASHPLDTRMLYESPNAILAELMSNADLLLEYIKSKKIIPSASEDEEPAL